ncbi:MAG TPA: hypothetical protein VEW95_10805 [Candidatus Limnocylindrales bacterium]|nr:hypothetical protein [Candidatus Limnocylindrales bacterium]
MLLVALAAVFAVILLGGDETPEGNGDPSPGTTTTSSPGGSSTSPADPSIPVASASGSSGTGFTSDEIVATAVDALTLREAPGLEGDVQWRLPEGTPGLVIAGPVQVDGLAWYQLSGMGLPYASGCITPEPGELLECPAWLGWMAADAEDGTPYLVPAAAPPCAEPPHTIVSLSERQYTLRLICFDSEPLTFRAWWPEAPDDAGLGGACSASETDVGWLVCQNLNDNRLGADPSEPGDRFTVSLDPASGVEMPERGQWIEITGHFDDPAAQRCGDVAEQMSSDPGALAFDCRLQFVLSAVAPTAAP